MRSNGADESSCGVGSENVLGCDEVVNVALEISLLRGRLVYGPVSVNDVLEAGAKKKKKSAKKFQQAEIASCCWRGRARNIYVL